MDKERALEYWINRHNHTKDYSDIHWDAEERHEHRDYVDAMAWAIKALEQYTEAAGVQPAKHGKWKWDEKPIFGNPYGSYICSECGAQADYKENYCYNCGADMREPEAIKG